MKYVRGFSYLAAYALSLAFILGLLSIGLDVVEIRAGDLLDETI